jgi:murein DD-endopeptidase MepM/ murein hydrolase activator NlpD
MTELFSSESELIFHLPFPRGEVVVLQQGNNGPENMSHSLPNCRHALDFTGVCGTIVAAASGEVVQVFKDARVGDNQAGYGFGNFVKIRHPQGLHSFYAHLSSVTVEEGEFITCGYQIGVMGSTGWAGNRHLHFSLHEEPLFEYGAGPTVPIKHLVTWEVGSYPLEFSLYCSEALRDFRSDGFRRMGVRYASANTVEEGHGLGKIREEEMSKILSNSVPLSFLMTSNSAGDWSVWNNL